jgi:hypothetical protein
VTVIVAPAPPAISRAMVSICNGPMSAAGRVDHLARQGAGRGDGQGLNQIDAIGRHQMHRPALRPGLVAVEQIGPERELERGGARVRPPGRPSSL